MELLKKMLAVGGWTLVYRITSFFRDILQSHVLGIGMFADLFSISFNLVSIFRKLFTEGGFNASFVPIFLQIYKKKNGKNVSVFVAQTFTILVIVAIALTLSAFIFIEPIMSTLAGGISVNTPNFINLVQIVLISLPYISFSFLSALFCSILNSLDEFHVSSASQITLNLVLICSLLLGKLGFQSVAYTMSFGVAIGGFIQTVLLFVMLRSKGIHLYFSLYPIDKNVFLFFKKLVPGLLGAGVWQLNVIISTFFLTLLPVGTMSSFYYIEHINQLITGVVGAAYGVVLIPVLSKIYTQNKLNDLKKHSLSIIKFSLEWVIPATGILYILSENIIRFVYQGSFTNADVVFSVPALQALTLGLPAYVLMKIFSSILFTIKNTKQPLIAGLLFFIVNIVGAYIFVPYFKHTGIAISMMISSWGCCLYMALYLKKNIFNYT